jgi:hypothetical protein
VVPLEQPTRPVERLRLLVSASALLCGATPCAFNVRREGLSALADWMVEQHISIHVSVSSLFRSVMRTLDPARRFPDVRLGDLLTASTVAKIATLVES